MLFVIGVANVLPWAAMAVAILLIVAILLHLHFRSEKLSRNEIFWFLSTFVVLAILGLFGPRLLLASL